MHVSDLSIVLVESPSKYCIHGMHQPSIIIRLTLLQMSILLAFTACMYAVLRHVGPLSAQQQHHKGEVSLILAATKLALQAACPSSMPQTQHAAISSMHASPHLDICMRGSNIQEQPDEAAPQGSSLPVASPSVSTMPASAAAQGFACISACLAQESLASELTNALHSFVIGVLPSCISIAEFDMHAVLAVRIPHNHDHLQAPSSRLS